MPQILNAAAEAKIKYTECLVFEKGQRYVRFFKLSLIFPLKEATLTMTMQEKSEKIEVSLEFKRIDSEPKYFPNHYNTTEWLKLKNNLFKITRLRFIAHINDLKIKTNCILHKL